MGVIAMQMVGCGGDSSDSTLSSGLYDGPACQDDLASADCVEEVEAETGEAVEQGEESLSEEQAEDQERNGLESIYRPPSQPGFVRCLSVRRAATQQATGGVGGDLGGLVQAPKALHVTDEARRTRAIPF